MSKKFTKVFRGLSLPPQASAPLDAQNGDIYWDGTDLLVCKAGVFEKITTVAPAPANTTGFTFTPVTGLSVIKDAINGYVKIADISPNPISPEYDQLSATLDFPGQTPMPVLFTYAASAVNVSTAWPNLTGLQMGTLNVNQAGVGTAAIDISVTFT